MLFYPPPLPPFPLPPSIEHKKSKFWKNWKKMLEISFYNCLPKITIIWHISFLRYKARQTEFVIGSHSTPLTFHKIKILKIDINSLWCTINDNHSTASEIWREMSRIFCHFGSFFTLSSHKQSQKIRMFKYI